MNRAQQDAYNAIVDTVPTISKREYDKLAAEFTARAAELESRIREIEADRMQDAKHWGENIRVANENYTTLEREAVQLWAHVQPVAAVYPLAFHYPLTRAAVERAKDEKVVHNGT